MSDTPTQTASDDDWILEDDEPAAAVAVHPARAPWRILIVDDEPDIHAVTRMPLTSVKFKDRAIELLSAYSGKEGFEVLSRESDIALVLLDVVMETDDAGLVLARRIREELKNTLVRIVLRTGQPGQAPEDRVIVEYDINDYKGKTELTRQKLFTTVISSLRSYEGLLTIERSRAGLDKILLSMTDLYHLRSLQGFSSGVLRQISAIIDVGTDGVLCLMQDSRDANPSARIIAATGDYASLAEKSVLPADHPWSAQVQQALRERRNVFAHPVDVLFIEAAPGQEFVIVLTPSYPLNDFQCSLLSLFCERIAVAFNNLTHQEELVAVSARHRASADQALVLLGAKEGSVLDATTLAQVQQLLTA
jgi:CheY-like chemotaxis protein